MSKFVWWIIEVGSPFAEAAGPAIVATIPAVQVIGATRPMLNQDSSPIVAYFTDRDIADQCLSELRKSGILNEQIGVSDMADTVLTPANDPDVYRVTGQQNTGSEIQDYEHLDDVETRHPSHFPIPTSRDFSAEHEAGEYEHPIKGLIVSVSVEPTRRDEVRKLLHQFGGRLTDWPASNDKVA